jgi:hypothetical protein
MHILRYWHKNIRRAADFSLSMLLVIREIKFTTFRNEAEEVFGRLCTTKALLQATQNKNSSM